MLKALMLRPTITVLMGFPAGSGVDVVARMLQPSPDLSRHPRPARR